MSNELEGLVKPEIAVKVGKLTILLFVIIQLIVAPHVEELGWYSLIPVMPPTVLTYLFFAKSNGFAQFYMWLYSVYIVSLMPISLVFVSVIMACQINWYRHMKAGSVI